MPVPRPVDGEIENVRVQDFILKTHIDYLDEHEKGDMKGSINSLSGSFSSTADPDTLNADNVQDEVAMSEPHVPGSSTKSSRTQYHRNSKPTHVGALKEKEVPLVNDAAKSSADQTHFPKTSSSSTTATSKDMSKARIRYRGYNFYGLALNAIKTDDDEYKKMLLAAMKYPSYFQPFSSNDLLYRYPPEHAAFKNVPHVQLLMGQKSSITKFHQEALNSHSMLVLLSGTKRWFFKYPEAHGKSFYAHLHL